MRRRKVWMAIACLLVLVAFDYATYPLLASKPSKYFDKGTNGIWLRYPWYFGSHTDSEIAKMADRLQKDGIHYAFFHVRDARPDGSLRYPKWEEASRLNRVFSSASPSMRRIAWFYVGNKNGRGAIELSNKSVRDKLVSEAKRLIDRAGFEGVQWDYEICPDGDRDFLSLLDESRESLGAKAWIGAAIPTSYRWPLAGFGWSEEYIRQVGRRCDQISVMTYDTGMRHPRLFTMHAQYQVRVLSGALDGLSCTFLIGLPNYGSGYISHDPRSERLDVGIHAIRGALENKVPPTFEGIALFADYTTDRVEWVTYRQGWRGSPGRSQGN